MVNVQKQKGDDQGGFHSLIGFVKFSNSDESCPLHTDVNSLQNVFNKVLALFMRKIENKSLEQSVLHRDAQQSIKFQMYSLVCQLLHAFRFTIHIFVPQIHVKDVASNYGLTRSAVVVP